MKILLIKPPATIISHCLDRDSSFLESFSSSILDKGVFSFYPFESLDLITIKANLKNAGYSVRILDACLEEITIDDVIKESMKDDYSIIGFTGTQPVFRENVRIAQRLKELGVRAHLTAGGISASLNHYELLSQYSCFDSIVRGEGELTVVELANSVEKNYTLEKIKGLSYRDKESQKIIVNPEREPIDNLDRLPFPDRSQAPLVLDKGFSLGIDSSRGCGHSRCSFCSMPTLASSLKLSKEKQWRYRSPSNIVDEIESLVCRFGIDKISFADAHFLGAGEEGRARAIAIAHEIQRRKLTIKFFFQTRADDVQFDLFKTLKESGLGCVFIGIESSVQRILDIYKKGITPTINERAITILRKLKIKFVVGYILFDPFSSFEELVESFKYLESLQYYDLYKYLRQLMIIPKSEIFHLLNSQGRISGDFLWYDYRFVDKKIEILFSIQWRYARLIYPLYKAFVKKKCTDKHMLKYFLDNHNAFFNDICTLLLKKGTDIDKEEINRIISFYAKKAKDRFLGKSNGVKFFLHLKKWPIFVK